LLLLAAVLVVFFWSSYREYSEGIIRANSFSALIMGNMLLILSGLSYQRSVWQVLAEGNKALWVILGFAGGMLALVLLWPEAGKVLSMEQPNLQQFVSVPLVLAGLLFVFEMMKLMKKRQAQRVAF
jgi:Ca2+-transporting ATPase